MSTLMVLWARRALLRLWDFEVTSLPFVRPIWRLNISLWFGILFLDMMFFWGSPIHTQKGGVGFLVRNGSAWHTTPLSFPHGSACHRLFQSGRLHGITLWLGNGSYRFNCYVLCGHAGSRWNSSLRDQTHHLIQAVLDDSAARGLPAIFGGDLNLTMSDSSLLQRLDSLQWTSLASMVQLQDEHTSFKGQGSTIDYIFANQLALCSFESFHLGLRTGLADHSPLHCTLATGCCSQLTACSRDFGRLSPGISYSSIKLEKPVVSISSSFQDALRSNDFDSAFRYWSIYAEKHLNVLWDLVASDRPFHQGRGCVRLASNHVWPPCKKDGPASLSIRRLWRHVCRMVEIQKRPFGTVATRTWQKSQSMLHDLPSHLTDRARTSLQLPCGIDAALQLQQILEEGITYIQNQDRSQRIKQWKHRLQKSVKAQHAWIKRAPLQSTICFDNGSGERTANVKSLFGAVRQAWQSVHELFKNGEPSATEFFDKYDQFIFSGPSSVPVLTGDMLRKACLSTIPTSPGLDGWHQSDLHLLAHGAPWVFDSLAILLQCIEDTGIWPSALIAGFTTLIPKEGTSVDNPGDLRPLTVLSSIYRVWARLRAQQLAKDWQEAWAHPDLWGGRINRGAEAVFLAVCTDLELCPTDQYVAGLSFDLSKAFDRVPRELLACILQRMNMPVCVWRPYIGMLRSATRRFKLGKHLDQSQPIYGGILQGCPLSMISMNAVINIWLHAVNSQVPQSLPRAYVDDVSVTVTGSNDEITREAVQSVLEVSSNFIAAIGGMMNHSKSFSFGSQCVKGRLQPDLQHCDEFRLLGGSVVFRDSKKVTSTALEVKRLKRWLHTVTASRHLPISWASRCAVLLRTRSQFTWGTGSHSLVMTSSHNNELNTLHSGILRCLLRRDKYVVSPGIYFALLASPSLCPQFCRVMDGIVTIWRTLRSSDRWSAVTAAFFSTQPPAVDGPINFFAASGFFGRFCWYHYFLASAL